MGRVPQNIGVFFGKADKGAGGWYWTDASSQKPKAAITGPFETKEQAIENALQSAVGAESEN
jgi:hypothetical protein